MTAAGEASQAQGELLEWLAEQGIRLMRWAEWTEPTLEECVRCGGYVPAPRCPTCSGTGQYEVVRHREGWVSDGRSIGQLLAAAHGIDLDVIEQEKRAMLDAIRARHDQEG
jgi:hypothetical protein